MIGIPKRIPTVETYPSDFSLFSKYVSDLRAIKTWYPKSVKTYLLFLHPQAIACSAGVSAVNPVGFRFCISTYEDQVIQFAYDPEGFSAIGKVLIEYNDLGENYVEGYEKKFSRASALLQNRAAHIYFEFKAKDISDVKSNFIGIVDSALGAQSYGYITEAFTITEDYW